MGTGKFDPSTGKFNLTINIDYLHRDPNTHLPLGAQITEAQLKTLWKPTFQKASKLLYEATDGKHQLGVIQVCNSLSNLGSHVADLNLFVDELGTSDAGGGYAKLGPTPTPGIHMTIWKDISERPLVIVHELGHFIYGLRDEYIVSPGTSGFCGGHDSIDAPRFTFCIMEASRDDGGQYDPSTNTTTYPFAGHVPDHISRFCVPSNHTLTNEQQLINGNSCWQTMRAYYPDLTSTTTPIGADQIDWVITGNAQRFVLVIDRSGSMMGDNKLTEAKFGADWWADALPDDDQIAIVSFSDTAAVNYQMHALKTPGDRNNIKNAISSISAQGTTSIGDGLLKARNEILNPSDTTLPSAATKAIVLLTDGRQNTGPSPYVTLPSGIPLLQDLNNNQIRVYTIGIGSDVDPILLQDIASQTGGTYYAS
jgi:hypothetical protein